MLFSPPLFLSSTVLSLSFTFSLHSTTVNVADVLLSGRRERCLKRPYYGKDVFGAKLPLVNITSVPIDLCIHESMKLRAVLILIYALL